VLYEGFLLFPYRKSALKNQYPWQFGVIMPQAYADRSEPTSMRAQLVLLRTGSAPCVEGVLRFLEATDPPTEREVPFAVNLRDAATHAPFAVDALRGSISATTQTHGDATILTLEIQNQTTTTPQADRNEALRSAFISAHVVLTAHDDVFASLLDPPDAAKPAAAAVLNERVFPVLVGEPGESRQTSSLALVSPIILYDFPAIAKASAGHTFDATEIDELLMLSVASLPEEEKREARAAHPYVRELVERAEALDADTQARLHGELTGGAREPGDETVTIGSATVARGSRVRVHPKGRADLWDDLVDGMTGRVCAVHTDFDGKRYIGVVFDGDPASDLHEWYGRSFFYSPDEVEPQ
jgi:hypothetical protein